MADSDIDVRMELGRERPMRTFDYARVKVRPARPPLISICGFSILGVMEIITQDEIARLSPPERLELIGQLWDSLDQEHLPLTGAQQEELAHRLTSIEADRRNGITWAQLKTELEQRCP